MPFRWIIRFGIGRLNAHKYGGESPRDPGKEGSARVKVRVQTADTRKGKKITWLWRWSPGIAAVFSRKVLEVVARTSGRSLWRIVAMTTNRLRLQLAASRRSERMSGFWSRGRRARGKSKRDKEKRVRSLWFRKTAGRVLLKAEAWWEDVCEVK